METNQIVAFGNVIQNNIIQSHLEIPLDQGTIVYLEDGTKCGEIQSIFGPVKTPFYTMEGNLDVGTVVYYNTVESIIVPVEKKVSVGTFELEAEEDEGEEEEEIVVGTRDKGEDSSSDSDEDVERGKKRKLDVVEQDLLSALFETPKFI
jgi:rRNA processing protein Gar1